MKVKVTKNYAKQFEAAVKVLTKTKLYVGIPQSKDNRTKEKNELGNAALGYIHEHGAPEVNIPARPFLAQGIKSIQPEIEKRLLKAGKLAMDGQLEQVGYMFESIGLLAQAAVRNKINNGPFEPLKKKTIRKRQRRGHTGEKPLIDTGQLIKSINYVVKGVK